MWQQQPQQICFSCSLDSTKKKTKSKNNLFSKMNCIEDFLYIFVNKRNALGFQLTPKSHKHPYLISSRPQDITFVILTK